MFSLPSPQQPDSSGSTPAPSTEYDNTIFRDFPIPFAITRFDDGRYIATNRAFESTFGWREEEARTKTSLGTGIWHTREERDAFLRQLADSGNIPFPMVHVVCRDGVSLRRRLYATLLPRENGQYVFSGFIDVYGPASAENDTRIKQSHLFQIYDCIMDGYAWVDSTGHFVECNRAFHEMLGYTKEEILQLSPRDVTPAHWYSIDIRVEQEQLMYRGYSDVYEKELIRKDGSVFPIELQLYQHLDANGNHAGFWGVVRDISERKRQQENIRFLAFHDLLTKLPNRVSFMEKLEHLLQRAKYLASRGLSLEVSQEGKQEKETAKRPCQMALLFIDLDHFKDVNDTLGHQVGDMLLQIVSRKMSDLLRDNDFLARFGGDEFICLLEAPVTASTAAAVAERILSLFSSPLILQEQEVYISASIGICLFPNDGEDAETLIKHADLAMFKAKNEGRNTFRFYEASLGADIMERVTLEHALRGALQRREFILHYQPQVDLATGRLAGVEALVRWMHPERGLIPPAHFIPAAENIGVICELGAWVLQEACRQMAEWHAAGFLVPRVAVNLSALQFERDNLVEFVQQQLEKYDLRPQMLELEVTESILMQQTEQTLAALSGLRKIGVYLAVDDFGTGYSSLGYLKSLPVHRLKIDYSFVRDIGRDSNDEAITRAVIALSSNLGLETVAEGVEREEQELFLRDEGCHIMQGYRYAYPLPAREVQKLYKKGAEESPGRSPKFR
ncbi:MAG: EAL domain-containing protein [Azoarcus sp.]|jgi:diguanylate cyclase (GGDEF)-like protein/PAS domain S-box-containing protein|nr:EAL domain-containing protein [Azoarcus sp.]